MRKITEQIVNAFENSRSLRVGNSYTNGQGLFLFGNKIAEIRRDGLWVNIDGWNDGIEYTTSEELAHVEPEDEFEFDTTSEWVDKGYSRPVYSVFHTLDESLLEGVEQRLEDEGIPSRRMESDTSGRYQPHYFVVVRPEDVEESLNLLNQ